ncbi:SMP-30/gluconolactonase/LRE family protein [Kocuria sp. M1R5S2]|uniref:SMP-30/gluconolactonase/LRE family protein n=1 Tax=Kocuria rhizosphaerae TaxID=3376285 RepID=UPI00378BA75A
MVRRLRAERITDAVTYHGEGPCWSESWGGLRWVDMLAGDVLSFGEEGRIVRRHVGDVVACVRPRATGGAVLAVETGVALEDPDGTVHPPVLLWEPGAVRMNEGGVGPDGCFWVGSMAWDGSEGAAALHRVRPDLRWETVLEGVTVSNGIGWSPDGSRVYYNDTPTGRIDVFDRTPAGGLTGRRTFVAPELEHGDALPDGLTVDSEGAVWVALYGAGQVHRYTPAGELDTVVEVGARRTTACCLGGADLRTLYVTTSREGLAPDEDPAAGSLFSVRVDVPGLPVLPFAG